MSKGQYDYIENKIREAAENSEPAFEEHAWDKMEAKLNAEKEKRRSPFLWFSLALMSFGLLGGIIILHNRSIHDLTVAASSLSVVSASKEDVQSTISNNSRTQTTNEESLSAGNKALNKSGNIAQSNVDQKNNQLAVQNNSSSSTTNVSSTSNNTVIESAKNDQSIVYTKSRKNTISNIVVANRSARIHISNKAGNETATDNNTASVSRAANKKYAKSNSSINNDKVATSDNSISYSSSQKNKRNTSGHTRSKIKAADQVSDVDEDAAFNKEVDEAVNHTINNKKSELSIDKDKKKDSLQKIIPKDTVAIQSAKKEIKESTQKINPWYVLGSIGADASNVTLFSFNNSSITPRYGVGIGYQINKRISVQTGFYAGRKKYVAGPGDYHSKDDSYLNNVNVTKISANCTIFEIPVTVRFNFALRPKTTYYATAGISSFIMNKEDYDYSYTAYNNNYQASHSYTGNKNLLSIATVSVGIERKISKDFSIQAEPSINIPIAGVGEGTVKLYSTDIQVGVKYNFHW